MKPFGVYFVCILAAYLVAAVPFSFIVGKIFYGKDLRKHGSRNLGATNTFRVLGFWPGISVVFLDMAKSIIPIVYARKALPMHGGELSETGLMLLLVCAIFGHTFSPYVNFRGGKGVAVAGGIILWVMPKVFLILVVTFATVIVVTRYVSLASITVAALFPFLVMMLYSRNPWVIAIALGASLYVIVKHRSNITRLIQGSENRLKWSRTGGDNPGA